MVSHLKIPFQENKQDISWNHIVNVYEEDLGMRQVAPGLKKLIKLREEHIRLTPSDRMQVKLAAQVSYLIFYCLLHASLLATPYFLKRVVLLKYAFVKHSAFSLL